MPAFSASIRARLARGAIPAMERRWSFPPRESAIPVPRSQFAGSVTDASGSLRMRFGTALRSGEGDRNSLAEVYCRFLNNVEAKYRCESGQQQPDENS